MQWRPDTSRRGIEKVQLVNLYCLVSRWVHLVFCIRHDFIAHCVEIARGASILTQVSPTPSCKYLLQVSIHKYLTQVSYTSILHEYLLHPLRETLSPSQKSKYKHKYLLHPLTSILHKYLTQVSHKCLLHPLKETLSHPSTSTNTISTTPSHPLDWRDNISTGRPCTGVPICDKVSSLPIRIFSSSHYCPAPYMLPLCMT